MVSSDLAISVRGLSKKYTIAHNAAKHATLAEATLARLKNPLSRPQKETFWALRDVSFDIRQGEVVGIIGRNGAGKSTLLKILSRITEPTSGDVDLYGRVGSLLEVGTGFHPELTGRENIFLNGAILGMTKPEIRSQFDAIVDFAEVEKFLDTPVKRYSSGMYVRLAFAVAAHLKPEILIVDEVLSVGDANFQKKCLGKMEEVGAAGRTVLFVSHSMPAVTRLCKRVVLLKGGKIAADGDVDQAVRAYLQSGAERPSERVWEDPRTAPGDRVARLRAVRVRDELGNVTEKIDIRRPVAIEVEYDHLGGGELRPTVSVHLFNDEGLLLFCANDFNNTDWYQTPRRCGPVKVTCIVPGNYLAEGRFMVLVDICSFNPYISHAHERDIVSFQVVDTHEPDSVRGPYGGSWPGVVRPMLSWRIESPASSLTSINMPQEPLPVSR
jgi:lipopolysaccharide transport system ATP-binding protein